MKEPLDHLKSRKQPMTKTMWIAGDPELAQELLDSESELTRLRGTLDMFLSGNQKGELATQRIMNLHASIEELETKVADLQVQVKESSIKFVFKALKRRDGEALVEMHPATEAQIAAIKATGAEGEAPFNGDTYPVALILESMLEPQFDKKNPEEYDQMKEWLESDAFNENEFMALFLSAIGAQQERKIVSLGKG